MLSKVAGKKQIKFMVTFRLTSTVNIVKKMIATQKWYIATITCSSKDIKKSDVNPIIYWYFVSILKEVVEDIIENPRRRLTRSPGNTSVCFLCINR